MPSPRSLSVLIFSVLATLMIVTRFKHFGDALHLPDASMAVFFLGGLGLRRHRPLPLLVTLAVAVDWVSIRYAGVSDFCVTPAYAFLPLAYALLWYAGYVFAPRLRATPVALASALLVACLAASVSFAVSNGAFYWLGGRYADPNLAQYLSRLLQWGPLFIRATLAYVAAGLVCFAVATYCLQNHRFARV